MSAPGMWTKHHTETSGDKQRLLLPTSQLQNKTNTLGNQH